MKIDHEFVEKIPDNIEEGKIYISLKYNVAVHKCACGCGEEVVTPLSPTDWKLIYDGETVSLTPSIGNWSFECMSHYWIKNSNIIWAEKFTDKEIEKTRKKDLKKKKKVYNDNNENKFVKLLKRWFFK